LNKTKFMHAPEAIPLIQQALKPESKVMVTTHLSPDGDAIGSSLGLLHGLQDKVQSMQCVIPNEAPDFLKWMDGFNSMLVADEAPEKVAALFQDADIWVVLDYNAEHRAGKIIEELAPRFKGTKIVIDHHLDPSIPCDILLSDDGICSTAQLVYEVVSAINPAQLQGATLECLYTGLITDTGSFRFSSVDTRTHGIVSEMIEKGLKHWEVHQKIYDQNTLSRLQIIGYCLSEKMQVFKDGKVALIAISQEEVKRFGASKGDTEGLVNWALSIQGVEVAAFVREAEDMVKISFRSKKYYPVNEFSNAHFNGGGHKHAAGGRSNIGLQETVDRIKELFEPIEFQ